MRNAIPYMWLGSEAEAAAREADELRLLRREEPEEPADG